MREAYGGRAMMNAKLHIGGDIKRNQQDLINMVHRGLFGDAVSPVPCNVENITPTNHGPREVADIVFKCDVHYDANTERRLHDLLAELEKFGTGLQDGSRMTFYSEKGVQWQFIKKYEKWAEEEGHTYYDGYGKQIILCLEDEKDSPDEEFEK